MKKTWFIIIITVICLAGFNDIEAQKEANIWYFGNNAGLDFSGEYPVPIVGSKMEAREGVACISDSLGNLLFYTNGITVWNANHEVIATNLAGHKSSTMAASIVPNPVNDRQYYLFTTRITDNAPGANNSGGHPYIFDFSPSNPSGALIQDYSSNPLQPNSTEKFLSIPFGPNLVEETGIPGYWLLTHLFDSDIFNQFRLTDAIYPHATIQVGAKHDNRTDDNGANHGAIGYIKVSNQGDRIAVAVEGHKSFHLLRFNRENGQISRYMSEAMLPAGDPNNKREAIYDAYGVEFSPTGRFLYGS
ncbi:MAG: hypothetical protein HOC82_03150, partial [Bacteroidetes bacterium]|nr:hypothetical protein [Bacteroidota bacterium]